MYLNHSSIKARHAIIDDCTSSINQIPPPPPSPLLSLLYSCTFTPSNSISLMIKVSLTGKHSAFSGCFLFKLRDRFTLGCRKPGLLSRDTMQGVEPELLLPLQSGPASMMMASSEDCPLLLGASVFFLICD